MQSNVHNLQRFVDAQNGIYATALSEMCSGKKRTHWIWYVFPQLKGLGHSYNSEYFGLNGLTEARAYLADPVLGSRLKEAIETIVETISGTITRTTMEKTLIPVELDAVSILGEVDAQKLKSCLTLFSIVAPSDPLFKKSLEQLFAGERDPRTLALLNSREARVLNSQK